MVSLSNDSPVALWRQLKILLREKALVELTPGDRIPTEQELCEQFHISRITVRQAVSSLVKEGILARQRGRGTYVLPPKTAKRLDSQESPSGGGPSRVVLYSAERVVADRRLAAKMSTTVGEPLHKVRRLRLVDDEPISYITLYLPLRLFPEFTRTELESEHFRRLVEYRSGLVVTRGEEVIEAIQADRFRSELLHVPVGSPLLVVESIAYLNSGEVVEFSRAYHRADRSRLTRSVGGEQLHSKNW
ncbi:MAG: GntR family transcriptional regulator [Chloroflexota bacterium]